jgi:hypothetical protein
MSMKERYGSIRIFLHDVTLLEPKCECDTLDFIVCLQYVVDACHVVGQVIDVLCCHLFIIVCLAGVLPWLGHPVSTE